jgi:hypothetical protein
MKPFVRTCAAGNWPNRPTKNGSTRIVATRCRAQIGASTRRVSGVSRMICVCAQERLGNASRYGVERPRLKRSHDQWLAHEPVAPAMPVFGRLSADSSIPSHPGARAVVKELTKQTRACSSRSVAVK